MTNGSQGLEQLLGHKYDWVIFDEASDMAYYDPDQARLKREIEDLMWKKAGTSTYKPNYRSTPIPPPPFAYLISFIGGPWNGQQKYLEREKHLGGETILDNSHRYFAMPAPPPSYRTPNDDETFFEKACYRFVVIPLNETPFSDIPCVVAIFQG